tara:strand:- start:5756 stop:6139 length:384 start_codon:yes stop_codon:yes gene_type:complete
MSELLITILDQPKRENILRLRGRSRQNYEFRWARVGSRGFYALPVEDQRTIDDLFRKDAGHRRNLSVFALDKAPQPEKKVEVPNYDAHDKGMLYEEALRLGLPVMEKDSAPALRRLIDTYWQGRTDG